MCSQNTLICLMMTGLCLSAVPSANSTENEPAGDEWPFLRSFLKESFVFAREARLNVQDVLHLVGFSDVDIQGAVNSIEDVILEYAKHLTQDEKFRLENAAMELVMMIENNNLRLYGALSDLYMIKKVIYPHLDEPKQNILDNIEKVIMELLIIRFMNMVL
ncbi:uncharacterized protein LOC122260623 isoform X2 [Penaeus japonicus]|uniref:uncharacterized protein LOC122260623 isoform X2 n=1 Tax=Penaeus japonicus TaxID=27405 RepID=UPI001C7128A2|nr:uncharacterized protein LOC122260623 isoform X2 [Penaeus japonicus]